MATLRAMFKLFDGYSSTIDKINRKTDEATNKILRASGATDKFNSRLEAISERANKASSGLGKFLSRAAMIAGAVKGMNIADEYTNTAARLALINDGLQTQAELQDKIFAAAYRSRGAYGVMANAVARMGLLAKDAFGSNDELIAFTELVQKSFKVGGASTSEQASAMLQLSQAMAAGRLQGDEFRSIMENAPMIADAIAKYTGKSKGELKEMSAEGTITADIIKNAMFKAADDINAKFEKMPMTFGDIWNRIKNGATRAFSTVIEKVNKLINTEGFNEFVNNLVGGINLIAQSINWLIDIVTTNWDAIKAILTAIGTVYLAYIISKIIETTVALLGQAAAWLVVYWPILLVIAAIGLAIYVARQFGATWEQIAGNIMGIIYEIGAMIYNVFALLYNVGASLAEFLANIFIDPVYAIKKLFFDLSLYLNQIFLGIAQQIENLLNAIPGIKINITSSLKNLVSSLESYIGNMEAEKAGKVFSLDKLGYKDFIESFNKGYNVGSKFVGSIAGLGTGFGSGIDMSNFGTSSNPIAVKGTGKDGAVKVDMADEDLKYLRDIAQREYINKFSTATLAPNITVKFGDVHETADANKLYGRVRKILQEEIAVAAEGSYPV
mgnify:FL=1